MSAEIPPEFCQQKSPTIIRRVILKDLAVISVSVFMSTMAYSGLINLQTSLNNDDDLGNKSLTVLYAFAVFSTFFLTVIIEKLGLKWTLLLSISTQIAYPVANFWPVWYSMYPGAAITGLGTSPLWTSANAYLTLLSQQYGRLRSEATEVVISRFFGIFSMAFRGATVTGSMLSSIVFQRPESQQCHLPIATINSVCGANYCYENIAITFNEWQNASSNNSSDVYRPSSLQTNMLFGIYVICSVVAIPLMALLRKMSRKLATQAPKGFRANISEMFGHMVDRKAILIMPLAVYSGVIYAFTTADFVVGFITCSLGIDSIGFVMACFGAASAFGSILCGVMLKCTGRQAIFIFGGISNISTLLAMVLWIPTSEAPFIFYLFASSLGVACSIWVSQLAAFLGYIFADECPESAFACFMLYQMFGNCIWHGLSAYLCLYQQLYLMIALLGIGLAGYSSVEAIIWKEHRRNAVIQDINVFAITNNSRHHARQEQFHSRFRPINF